MNEKVRQAVKSVINLLSDLTPEERTEVLKSALHPQQFSKDSHGLESFIPETTSDPEWDPQAPEDGGHPW